MKYLNSFNNFYKINEDLIHENNDIILEFIDFATKHLGLSSKPKVDLQNERDGITTTASFYPITREIKVYCNGRHLVDILRSIAHEMVHLQQLEQKRFEIGAKDIGGKQEDEANAVAGQLIKKFAEQYPNVYESTNL